MSSTACKHELARHPFTDEAILATDVRAHSSDSEARESCGAQADMCMRSVYGELLRHVRIKDMFPL